MLDECDTQEQCMHEPHFLFLPPFLFFRLSKLTYCSCFSVSYLLVDECSVQCSAIDIVIELKLDSNSQVEDKWGTSMREWPVTYCWRPRSKINAGPKLGTREITTVDRYCSCVTVTNIVLHGDTGQSLNLSRQSDTDNHKTTSHRSARITLWYNIKFDASNAVQRWWRFNFADMLEPGP